MFRARPLEDLLSLDGDVARGIHADSDSAAFYIQDGNGDAVSDNQGFGQPAGQNEHDPLPPDTVASITREYTL
jgi:hypothetical protein